MPRPLRITFWIVGGLLGFFVVVGIIGAVTMEPEDPEATPAATTTSTTSTTTTAPATTSEHAFTEQECAEEILGFQDGFASMDATVTAMQEDLDAGQVVLAEVDYWDLWGQMAVALDLYGLWMEVCDHMPADSIALVASFESAIRETWNGLEQACLAELKAQGWECSPAHPF